MSSRDLKKLTDKWYRKLKKSGFDDIEDTSRDDRPLKKWHGYEVRLKHGADVTTTAMQRYYELARHFFNDHVFETSKEKEMWRMHSEGDSGATIAKRFKTSCSTAKRTIQRLAKLMLSQRVGTDDKYKRR